MNYTVRLKPIHTREVLVAKDLEVPQGFGEVIWGFGGERYQPTIISLPIDVPVYRMRNCRAFSAQRSYIARKGLPEDFFDKGQEAPDAQQAQHGILARIAMQGNSLDPSIASALREEGQREEILITCSGEVVNGNLRLAAMRELLWREDDWDVHGDFNFVRCAVLPPNLSSDEVDDIEAHLHTRLEGQMDYDWIGEARLFGRQAERGRSVQEISRRLLRMRSDIEKTLGALEEGKFYLEEWIGRPGEYDLIKDGEWLFCGLSRAVAGKSMNLQDASRAIAWVIYSNRSKVGRLFHRLAPAFGRLAPDVLELLESHLELPDSDEAKSLDDDFAVLIEPCPTEKNYRPIIKAMSDKSRREEIANEVIRACETAIYLDTGKKSQLPVKKPLRQASPTVAAHDAPAAVAETLSAVLWQLEAIREGVDRIESSVKARWGVPSAAAHAESEPVE